MQPRDKSKLRWSELSKLAETPAHYRYAADHDSVATAAMRLGSAVHSAVLTPSSFRQDYTIKDWDGRTAAGKAHAATIAAFGVEILSVEEADTCEAIATAIHDHPAASLLLADAAMVESEIVWDDGGIACAGRLDVVTNRGQVVDLKTARSISTSAIQRTVINRMYHGQLSWYRTGLMAAAGIDGPPPAIIWVESQPPYCVRVTRLSQRLVALGDTLVDRLLGEFRRCLDEDTWRGYSDGIEEIDAPEWATEEEPSDDWE